LALVAGAAAALALYSRFNDELRRHIESRIAQHYGGLSVRVRWAERIEGKGIRVRNLMIFEPSADGPQAELLSIEEAMFECSTDWQELIQGNPIVRRATLRRPTLRLTRRTDGSWNTARLLPPPQLGDHSPEIIVEHGVVEVFDPLKAPAGSLVLRDVNLTLAPSTASPLPLGEGPGVREAGATAHARQLQGMFSGDGFRRVEVVGTVDLRAGVYAIQGLAESVELSPELRDGLPNPLAAKLRAMPDLRGQANLQFELNYDPTSEQPLRFVVSGRLTRGRIDAPRLPRSLSDVRATVRIDQTGYVIDDFVARSGQAVLRMTLRGEGFEPTSPLRLALDARQFELDRALLDSLPAWAQDLWYKYRPAGEVDADLKLAFDGAAWQPEATVQCRGVSLTHHKFPYRLDQGQGTITLKDDRLAMNLTAYRGRQPIRLTAEASHPFHEPVGWFEAKGDDLPLDESLVAALPERPRAVVRSLDPHGTVSFYVRLWRDKSDEPMHQHIQVAPNRCSVRYEKFPYRLSDLRGTLEMFDGHWTFRHIEAQNDRARITCEGQLTPGLQGNELSLSFTGRDVALDDNLRDALSPHIQQVWRDLRPQGRVDLTAEVRYAAETNQFSVGVRAQPQPQSTSIEPVHFPYRLERLQGQWVYRDGHVAFEDCKAEHGAVKVSAQGHCDFQPDGRSNLHFTQLSADRLRIDRELLPALPERLRKAVVALNPTGAINLRGSFDLERTGRPDDPRRARWDVRLGLQQSNLQCGGILLENVHGIVELRGAFDGQQIQSRGQLALDSVRYKDCQLTQVAGPIWIDDGRVLFGSWVDRREGGAAAVHPTTGPAQTPRPITAALFGGKFYADGWATLGPEPRYALSATLTDADLARCAQEAGAGHHNLRGKVVATADLTGVGHTRNAMSGRGAIRLSEGDVYQLPLMISLLKLLSIRPPDQNAFSDAVIDYRIEGEHIYFDRIDFHGDVLSLRGKGEMNFQSAIRLTFYSGVGRGEIDLPVVKQVFSGASRQIMLIHVGGTLQNPETRKEALPGVNQVLQTLTGER